MRRALLVVGCTAAAVVAVGGGVLSGVVPLPGSRASARPPCSDLPGEQEVVTALGWHRAVTTALTQAVPGAWVSVSRPCAGDQADRALLRVTVPDGEARHAVQEWLGTHDGYGVPVEIETS